MAAGAARGGVGGAIGRAELEVAAAGNSAGEMAGVGTKGRPEEAIGEA